MIQNQTIEMQNGIVEISFCDFTKYQSIVKRSSNVNKGIILDTKKDSAKVIHETKFYDNVPSEEYLKFYLNY